MSCNNMNGQTYVNTCIAAPGATAEEAVYVVDLTHYTCGNRKICSNGAYPITGNLNYRVVGVPQSVGNATYVVDILITGTVTYMPYRYGQNQCGCGCNCPVTENVWATVSVPVSSSVVPKVVGGDDVIASPTNLRDCCSITNAIALVGSFVVSGGAATAAEPSVRSTKK